MTLSTPSPKPTELPSLCHQAGSTSYKDPVMTSPGIVTL